MKWVCVKKHRKTSKEKEKESFHTEPKVRVCFQENTLCDNTGKQCIRSKHSQQMETFITIKNIFTCFLWHAYFKQRPNLFPLTNSIVLTDIDFTQSLKCTKLVSTCRSEKKRALRAQRQAEKTKKGLFR